ncbi:MAG: hypothetical protein WKF87_12230 [Chryseolinea sp.]
MDDSKLWFYAVVGGVYVLSLLLKKGKKTETPTVESRPTVEKRRNVVPEQVKLPTPFVRQPKPVSFEDLMREIVESKRPPSQDTVVDYDDEIGEEERDLEDVNYDHRKQSGMFKTYEDAKTQAFNRPSLEETMRIEDTVMTFGKFKEFDSGAANNVASEYLKLFTNQDELKKAVVMSEILKTKF